MASGDRFKQEGEKALGRTTIFGFGKAQKYEDAAAAFVKAGNAYKMSGQHEEAAEVFLKAADAQKNTDSPSEAANSFVEAGNCYKKVEYNDDLLRMSFP
jgi:hypothetical protein